MYGAVIGDIVGSKYEHHNLKSKDFPLFDPLFCKVTDDSLMTEAVAGALLLPPEKRNWTDPAVLELVSKRVVSTMRAIGVEFFLADFGTRFRKWLLSEHHLPYGSHGNGAPMRVSPVAYAANTLDECKALSRAVTEVTHNSDEAIHGAEAVAVAIFLARTGKSKEEIRQHIVENYYPLDTTLDELRPRYFFCPATKKTVPPAMLAFFESTDFEDAIRNAISVGGDSDTIAAITGSIAEAYYGIPEAILIQAMDYFSAEQLAKLKFSTPEYRMRFHHQPPEYLREFYREYNVPNPLDK